MWNLLGAWGEGSAPGTKQSLLSSLLTPQICLPFHTQPAGIEGGSMEMSLSSWAQRGTGYFAFRVLFARLVFSSASHVTVQTNHLRILLNVASDSVGLGLILRF